MTDHEIISIMYDHANAFSSCVQFSEQGVIDFARAILAANAPAKPKPVKDCYEQKLQAVIHLADELNKAWCE